MNNYKTVYICDRKACSFEWCNVLDTYECSNTVDPEHALYGACKDPWNHPERFEKIKICGGDICYWEKKVEVGNASGHT